ncbi:MAG: hypothetical protein HC812_19385 [Leptolyngbya sp. RL_3_1]|nr:hypothetical protein [Leptolyngbya sp. RL_3_1]
MQFYLGDVSQNFSRWITNFMHPPVDISPLNPKRFCKTLLADVVFLDNVLQ